jgi:hypothetical protein
MLLSHSTSVGTAPKRAMARRYSAHYRLAHLRSVIIDEDGAVARVAGDVDSRTLPGAANR